ncbi:MAG TPA: hypothetical protein DEP84_02145 [Chloroflexi bacterium]|nr:hypothetical protein [Chloroflexota bacterium]
MPCSPFELVSTIDNSLAFRQMRLNMGSHGRERILPRPLVELVTADHLIAKQKTGSERLPGYWDNHGWGGATNLILGSPSMRRRQA